MSLRISERGSGSYTLQDIWNPNRVLILRLTLWDSKGTPQETTVNYRPSEAKPAREAVKELREMIRQVPHWTMWYAENEFSIGPTNKNLRYIVDALLDYA